MSKTIAPSTYYDILKVSPGASDEDISLAYRRLAKIYHPDQNNARREDAQTRLQKLNEAYAALKTQETRNRYNAILKTRTSDTNANDNKKKKKNHTIWQTLKEILSPVPKTSKGTSHV